MTSRDFKVKLSPSPLVRFRHIDLNPWCHKLLPSTMTTGWSCEQCKIFAFTVLTKQYRSLHFVVCQNYLPVLCKMIKIVSKCFWSSCRGVEKWLSIVHSGRAHLTKAWRPTAYLGLLLTSHVVTTMPIPPHPPPPPPQSVTSLRDGLSVVTWHISRWEWKLQSAGLIHGLCHHRRIYVAYC